MTGLPISFWRDTARLIFSMSADTATIRRGAATSVVRASAQDYRVARTEQLTDTASQRTVIVTLLAEDAETQAAAGGVSLPFAPGDEVQMTGSPIVMVVETVGENTGSMLDTVVIYQLSCVGA